MARSWVYQLLKRFALEGEAVFEPHSKRPRSSRAAPATTTDLVVLLRRQLRDNDLDAGADTISWHLLHKHHMAARRVTRMLIVISGTHASGKSTLISDFVALYPEFEVLGDPFDALEDADVEPGTDSFSAQLQVSAARLMEPDWGVPRIAERGPVDFLAYLDALVTLRRPGGSSTLFRNGLETAAAAMAQVDLLVLLPLAGDDGIEVPADEDPELRSAMNDSLLELADDPDLIGSAAVVEITGSPTRRLAQLEDAVESLR